MIFNLFWLDSNQDCARNISRNIEMLLLEVPWKGCIKGIQIKPSLCKRICQGRIVFVIAICFLICKDSGIRWRVSGWRRSVIIGCIWTTIYKSTSIVGYCTIIACFVNCNLLVLVNNEIKVLKNHLSVWNKEWWCLYKSSLLVIHLCLIFI